MPFEHSCFISYRNHDQNALADRFLTELHDALHYELSMQMDSGIYLDRSRMQGGSFFNSALARALCTSACMVPVYTPTYFNRQKLYCAREYHAMETLEARRLARLPERLRRECGLIFPVVLRGKEKLPAKIKDHRTFYNFERFDLASEPISKNPNFKEDIRALARAIQSRAEMLEMADEDLTCDCDTFDFPSEQDVMPWLDAIVPSPQSFPLRGKLP
jgi:TIR domain